jgi:hypothetical protein
MRSGNISEDRLINEELIFINLVGIPSYPVEFFGFKDFIICSISFVDTDFKFIFGNGCLNDC